MGGRKEARHGRLSAKLRQQKSLVAHLSLPGLALGFIFCCAGRSLNNTRAAAGGGSGGGSSGGTISMQASGVPI